MTKADLAALVAEKGLTKKQAMAAVEATFEALKDAMSKGEKIQLVGFGSFQVLAKRARKGRNPQTGPADMYRRRDETHGGGRRVSRPSGSPSRTNCIFVSVRWRVSPAFSHISCGIGNRSFRCCSQRRVVRGSDSTGSGTS